MRKYAAALLCVMFTIIAAPGVWAGEYMSTVRVGLESLAGAEGLAFGDRSLSVGYDTGGGFIPQASFETGGEFAVKASSMWYTSLPGLYSYQDAELKSAELDAMGYMAFPCMKGEGLWMVYTGPYADMNVCSAQAANMGGSAEQSYSLSVLTDSGVPIAGFEGTTVRPQFKGLHGMTVIGGRAYRGIMEMYASSSGLTPVNVLSIEDYLYGVVPSEMPSDWPMEALKAQAVAARTYAHTRSGIHVGEGYGLCDGDHCQVYKGMNEEAIGTIIAVDATRDVLALYDGQPIEAMYFSSSGGKTENSEDVWLNSLPYLRSVTDTYETDAREWSRSLTTDQMNGALAASGHSIGSFTGLSVAELTAGGHVNSLLINGTAGNVVLDKEAVRTFFSQLPGGSLESRTFTISYGPFAGTGVGGVNITGRGYGHGVGMSQYGAKGMAEAGFTFDQILRHYYTGITVGRLGQ